MVKTGKWMGNELVTIYTIYGIGFEGKEEKKITKRVNV